MADLYTYQVGERVSGVYHGATYTGTIANVRRQSVNGDTKVLIRLDTSLTGGTIDLGSDRFDILLSDTSIRRWGHEINRLG